MAECSRLFSDSEDDEILLLTLALKKRRKWVHGINVHREIHGEYHHLVQEIALDKEKFREYFRLSRDQFEEVLSLIENDIRKMTTNYRKSLSAHERLAICLRFLATGDTFKTIAFSYRVGKSTVSEVVEEVCEALWRRLQERVMPEPDEELGRKVEQGFKEKWNFPHCVGALDGKHINIRAPINSGSQYFNYKKLYSVVLLALVDADYKFIIIDSGSFGKNSDGSILNNSSMGTRLRTNTLSLPPDEPLCNKTLPYVIVGDEAFPLRRYLMRPFPRDGLNEEKRVFNYRFSRCRRVSENAFGIYVAQWRVFQRPLQCKLKLIDSIVKATAVLHNFIRNSDQVDNARVIEDSSSTTEHPFTALARAGMNSSREAFQIRNSFMEYFNSEEGSVPWQMQIVNRT